MLGIIILIVALAAAFAVMHHIEKRYEQNVRPAAGRERQPRGKASENAPQPPRQSADSSPAAESVPGQPSIPAGGSSAQAAAGTTQIKYVSVPAGAAVRASASSQPEISSPQTSPNHAPALSPAAIQPVDAERIAGMERAIDRMEGALSSLKDELRAFREAAAIAVAPAADMQAGVAGNSPPVMAGTIDAPSGPADARQDGYGIEKPQEDRKPGGEFVSPNLPAPGQSLPAAKAVATPSIQVEGRQDMDERPGQEAEVMAMEGWHGEAPSGAPISSTLERGDGVRRPRQFAAAFAEQHDPTAEEAAAHASPSGPHTERAASSSAPGFLERAWESLGELGLSKFLGASNIWVLAGMGLLLVGLVFLVRFAIEHGILGPEARLGVAALVGLALLATGWKHRETRRELGLILQGGGVGALYLTVVAAVKLYTLLPQPLALALLVGIVVFSTVIAVIQNAKIMAHIANGAGFLAPVLVSTDSGNYVALFTFYILLNLGIIGISRFRQWRSLHLTAFVFTAGIGGLWGMARYEPSLFLSVEPFLLVFFAIFTYLAIAGSKPSSFSLHKKMDVFIDAPLTLATPLVFILYQAAISRELDFVLAFTCLALGLLYLSIARFMWNSRNDTASEASWLERSIGRAGGKRVPGASVDSDKARERMRDGAANEASDAAETAMQEGAPEISPVPDSALAALIKKGRTLQAEIYLAFGIVFTNLALPLALYDLGLYSLSERLLSLVWALEGASLVWLGRRNAMRLFRVFGLFSLFLGFIYTLRYISHGAPFYTGDVAEALRLGGGTYLDLGISLLLHLFGAAAFTAAALAVHRHRLDEETPELQQALRRILLGGAAVWLYGAFFFEFYSLAYHWELVLLGCAVTAPLGAYLARRFDWRELTFMSLACYVPYLVLFVPQVLTSQIRYIFGNFSGHPTELWTFGALLLFTLYDLFLLRRSDKEHPPLFSNVRLVGMLNVLPVMLTVCTVSAAANLAARFAPESTLAGSWFLALCVVWPCLFLGLGIGREKLLSLTGTAGRAMAACAVPVFVLVFWFAQNLFVLGNPAPLPYIPVLNPLEAALLASSIVLYIWVAKAHAVLPANPFTAVLGRQAFWVVVLFLLANVTVARACAFWLDMPFTLSGVMRNGSCQGVMAVLWALTGFAAMLHGHKTLQRSLWLSGVVLMLADIAKLFFIDLTRVETLWRIVAFMAVGLLLIVIGYKVPLPPARKNEEDGDNEGNEGAEDAPHGT